MPILSDVRLIRGASPSRHGGIHWYEWRPKDEALIGPSVRDLVLLHPMSEDGAFFDTIAPHLAAGRTVIAPDYPGHGRSDPYRDTPTIKVYADAVADIIRARDTHGRADLLGYRAGCLVATELSLRYSDEIHRLVQVEVPYFDDQKQGEMLKKEWAVGGFIAAFTYPCQARYAAVKHECLAIATSSGLLETTRAAAAALANGELAEFPEIEPPALENGAVSISAAALEFLDR
jgi:pimeloyl-ACP methyl ester carboxylesterase